MDRLFSRCCHKRRFPRVKGIAFFCAAGHSILPGFLCSPDWREKFISCIINAGRSRDERRNMDLNGVKYDAFISYRHCPLDMFIAKSIHRRLENFKLPKSILETVKAKGKKNKIERVFRDQDELPLADNLSDPIDVALTNSDFLIVICTPRLPQSQWCRKEITSFIEKHDRDHILAVLAEGEPYESFPYELTHEEVVISNPDGSTTTEVRELEPLAADVRGKSKRETEKMLDDAAVRLCAGIFELNYDDLKQRHKEQQTKKRVRILSTIAGVMFVFAMVCMALLLKINSQKKTINSQYGEIQDQYSQIQKQYTQIEEQYAEIQDKYEDAMVGSAEELLNEGRRNDALYALLHAINGNDCKSGTEYLLSKALNVYGFGPLRSPASAYDLGANVEEMVVNSEGTKIALKGTSGEMVVFDTQTGEKIYSVRTTEGQYSFSSYEQEAFASEDVVYYIDKGQLSYYNLGDGKGDSVLNEVETLIGDEKMGVVFAYNGGAITAFDALGKKLYSIDINTIGDDFSSYMPYLENYSFSPDMSKLIIESWYNAQNNIYLIIDVKTGKVISSYFGTNADLDDIALTSDAFYLMKTDMYFDASSSFHRVYAFDINTMEPLWEIGISGKFYSDIIADKGLLFLHSSSNGLLLDGKTGAQLNSWEELPGIVKAVVASENTVLAECNNGGMYTLKADLDEYMDVSISFYANAPTNKIMDVATRNNEIYLMFDGEKYVSRYAPGNCEIEYSDYQPPEEYLDYDYTFGEYVKLEDGVSKSAITSGDKKYTFSQRYDGTVVVYDSDNNVCSNIYNYDSQLVDVLYIDELDRYVLKGYSSSYLLDESLQIVGKIPSCYDYEDGNFIVNKDEGWYKIPYYDTKAIIDRAWEMLGDYVPSDEIAARYGIKQ